jgi:ADP-ribose pyrophosphatase YjhB (NUDIX family)
MPQDLDQGRGERRDVVVALWHRLRRFQWRLAWLRQSKFVVTATGLVRDDAGRVLLVRHRFWPVGRQVGLPGGYAVSGERLEDAVAREVLEETGLLVEVGHVVQLRSGFKLRVEATFAAALAGGEWRLDPHEVIAADFYEVTALPEDLMPNHRRLIEQNADWFRPVAG